MELLLVLLWAQRQAAGNPARAMGLSIRSLLRYPLPYGSHEVKSRFGLDCIRLFVTAAITQLRKLQTTDVSHTPPEHTPAVE